MNNWKSEKNYESNNFKEKRNRGFNNLKIKKNYAWSKMNKRKGSLTETWHLKGWIWNKMLKE